jgi:hypothetical protein
VAAVVTVPFRWWHDLQLLRACLGRLSTLVDRVAVVATSNPLAMTDDPEFPRDTDALTPHDKVFLKKCSGASAGEIGRHLGAWVGTVLNRGEHGDGRENTPIKVTAEVYAGEPDTRAHRNLGLRLADRLDADAVLMLNHDELIGRSVTTGKLQRILRHPNPLVRAFDVGIVYHHDAPGLVRDEPPYGHGGTYKGGPHAARLYRLRQGGAGQILPGDHPGSVPDHGLAAQRVAALRVRRFGLSRQIDRDRLGIPDHGEGLRVSQWREHTRLGLHVLLYEREDPDDVARWLDDLHALTDAVVLVWTGEWAEADKGWTLDAEQLRGDTWPATGPGRALAAVGHLHGVAWVHQPLEDDIAQARNAGIHALHDHGGLTWAMFVDPDEWLADRLQDTLALRNMLSSSRWGWLVQAANLRPGQEVPTISDSVRVSRLDDARRMVMNGRVHEGFTHALQGLQADGIHPRLVYAPFVLQHRGLAQDDATMADKLAKYEHLLRLQLQDDPHDPGAWVSLGWHCFNEGNDEQGLECYRRAVACAGQSYLPFKELAYHHLRAARALLDQCDDRLTDGHQFHRLLQTMRKWLVQYAPPHPIVGTPAQRDALPLPPWTPPDPSAG